MKIIATLGMLLLSAAALTPASAQQPELKTFISGAAAPTTMQLKDLDATWSVVTIPSQAGAGDFMSMIMSMYSGAGVGGANPNTYYTKGDTVKVGGDPYLIAWHAHLPAIDLAKLQQFNPLKPQFNPPLTGDTTIYLSLINLHTAGALADVHAFDLQREVQASEPVKPPPDPDADLSNIKQLDQGLLLYAEDYDDRLPPMTSALAVQHRIMPYIKNAAVFTQPSSGMPYLANAAISEKKVKTVASPATTITFYAPRANQAGLRAVAYLDGHAAFATATEWAAIRKRAHLR
ncbi:MAG: hypothetical protein KGJ62_06610 [Armatimonadetes bacterium]|nr:hypothetical protein [Armatimonadota bacterium]MDE2207569.1 hypothetical protein [Armatimonadota bacterium]